MPAVHSPSGGGSWSDPWQRGPEYRARHDDVAPEASRGWSPSSGVVADRPTRHLDYGPSGSASPDHPSPPERDPSVPPGPDDRGLRRPPRPVGGPDPDREPRGRRPPPGYAGPTPRPRPQPVPRPDTGDDLRPETETSDGSGRRAGRNLPVAIGVGVVLGAAVIASLYVWRPAFVILAVLATAVGIWEMVRAIEPGEAQPPLIPLLVGGPAIVALAWFAGLEAMVLGLVLTVAAVLVWRLGEGPLGYQRDVTSATLIAAYVPFLAGFAVLLVRPDDGAYRVTITIAAAVLSDVGGYAAGALLGRHAMAPTVSPKKSWEGFAGSVGASAVGSALMFVLMLGVPWWQGVIFGVAIAFAATLGDLSESLMKRDLGVKDMGRLLPGHGGLMDRLDSLLLAAPTGYLLLTLFAPPAG